MDNAINVTEWNYLSIFKLLDKEKKEVICLKLLQFISPIEKLKKDIENKIAQFSNMRSQTVSSLPIEKKGVLLAKTILRFPHDFIDMVFIDFHLTHQKELVCAFLDYLKIPHTDGHIDHNVILEPFDVDALEVLSVDEPERSRFLELISHPQNYEPAWDRTDAKFYKIRMLESAGEYNQAAALLTEEFHRLCADTTDQAAIQEASDIIEKIVNYGLGVKHIQPLKERLEAILSTVEKEPLAAVSTEEPFSIFFVGGNETQERYDATVLEFLAENHPNLKVTFYHTNWSSNWGDQLDKVKKQMSGNHYDLIITMRFIRTGLGKSLRRLCTEMGLNWYTCTGHGRSAVERAIIDGYRLFGGRR